MSIDLNVSPYYDDFNKSKGFYKILFKPGYAVQARELTQLQTILQNQIEAMGSNVFKNGSLVSGGRSFRTGGAYLKISTSGAISSFENKTIVGATSGARGFVQKAVQSFERNSIAYPSALYLNSYEGSFEPGEVITIDGTATSLTLVNSSTFNGPCSFFSIEESIFYINGYFVYCVPQSIVVSETFVSYPSARIGLKVIESIKNSSVDETLLDPALGSSNYFAPGADRYSIDLVLSSIEYDPTVENSDASTLENFIDFANIRNGEVIKLKIDSDYNKIEDLIAKRTFEESGNYTVKPFYGKTRTHVYNDNSKFTFELTPGKAYVNGYAFETIAPTYVTIDKPREINSVNNFPIAADYQRYITVKDVSGIMDPAKSQIVDLHRNNIGTVNVTSNTSYLNSYIGNARVRYLEFESSSPDKYNLYLFDINLSSGNTISEVRSILTPNTISTPYSLAFKANTLSSNATIINSGIDDSMIFKVPQAYIKTFSPGGVSDTSFTASKVFNNAQFVPGTGAETGNSVTVLTLTGGDYFIGSGTLSDTAIKERFYIAVSSNTTGAPNVYQTLDLTGAGGEIIIDSSGQNATLKWVGSSTFTANIVAVIESTSTSPKLKTLKTANVVLSYSANVDTNTISLIYPDVVSINSIEDSNNNTYFSLYTLDNGQRDDFYSTSKLNIRPGYTAPSLSANGYIKIDFNYFEHSGSGSYFSVDSYVNVGYEDIPDYVTSQGIRYSLADVLDFRPVKVDNTNSIVNSLVIDPLSTINADYEYYLGRADRIVITKDKTVSIIKGNSSLTPELPPENSEAMTIYTLRMPPYTKKIEQVSIGYVDNRRYTMKDIGTFEKRINRLEYYTALSFLEKIAADQRIPSAVPGIDRFKNGILVDPFSGHGVADVGNKDHICSIDQEARTLRPAATTELVTYYLDTTNSSNITQHGPLILPSYSETPFLSQTKATKYFNVTPYNVFNYVGEIDLNPSTDIWFDTYSRPTVTVNLNGANDAFTTISPDNNGLTPWATRWGSWNSVWRGVTDVSVDVSSSADSETNLSVDEAGTISARTTSRTNTTTSTNLTTSESFNRTGLQYFSSGKTITTNLGERLVDASLIPFIRQRTINFTAKNLKPNTFMYATFDNINVTDYCDPYPYVTLTSNVAPSSNVVSITQSGTVCRVVLQQDKRLYFTPDTTKNAISTGNVTLAIAGGAPITRTVSNVMYPTDIITDENGSTAGVFYLPNNDRLKFNVGERAFRLTDNLNKVLATSTAQTLYLAQGMSRTSQGTVLATRVNTVSIQPNSEYKTDKESTTSTTNNRVTTVEGPTSTIALVQNPDRGETNYTCNQQVLGKGLPGKSFYRILLEKNTIGSGNIIYSSGVTPTKFKTTYMGNTQETAFIMDTAGVSANSLTAYNEALNKLGFSNLINQSTGIFSFVKQRPTEDEYIFLEITSPIAGSNWDFSVNCPGAVYESLTPHAFISRGFVNYEFIRGEDRTDYPWGLYKTAAVDVTCQISIENQTNDNGARYAGDGSITVTGITLDESRITEKRDVNLTLETSGESFFVNSGMYNTKTKTNNGVFQINSWNNSLGTLPTTIAPGEQKTFGVRISKTAGGAISGRLRVVPTVVSTSTVGNVTPVSVEIPVSTVLNEPPPVIDPVAQTFFVDPVFDSNGIFVTSVDFWFATKSNTLPVMVQIRPVVNGYPSSTEIVPFATSSVDASAVVISSVADTFNISESTRFNFKAPVYLPPGQYAVVVMSNSTDYNIYSAVFGDFILGSTTERVSKQPLSGSLFKSQNASTWTAEQTEDLCLRINRASFTPNQTSTVYLKNNSPLSDIPYDVLNTYGEAISFPRSTVSYYYKRKDQTTGLIESSFVPFQLSKNEPMKQRKVVTAGTEDNLQLKIDVIPASEKVAPIIDLERLGSYCIRNIINNNAAGEDGKSGGSALARYLTKRVTLAPGFEAQDIKLYVNAYCPGTSSFKVYYKVNAPGSTNFDFDNEYVEMTQSSVSGNTRENFAEYIFENTGNTALPDGAKFNLFTIKIVLLSPNPSLVPILRDLRVIALDDY